MELIVWLLWHATGIDTQQSPFYDFWSGIGPCLFAGLALLVAVWSIRIARRSYELELRMLRLELEHERLRADAAEAAGEQ